MKTSKTILLLFCFSLLNSCSSTIYDNVEPPTPPLNPETTISDLNIAIPTGGNAWVLNNNQYVFSDIVTDAGIRDWNDPNKTIRTFFYVSKAGKIALGLQSKVSTGTSKIQITFQNTVQELILSENSPTDKTIGEFMVNTAGYYSVDIKGLEKEGTTYADIDAILVGVAPTNEIKYIKDDFYFGRRGPSVHLNFETPEDVNDVEWFYSELTVPENQDVIGSYFMANGFGEGYFGIQVNSLTERKILFSVWSPYETDNPNEIPEEYKIQVLKKGEGVSTGEFGNEGSGGQSYKVFNWKSEVNYGFLLGAKPTGDDHTDYTAYFHDPETNQWNLIAQFRRPKTNTYVKHMYSFLENFIPEQGVIGRKAHYGNQWIYNADGWHELTEISFTADNTARKAYRLDYSGGVENNHFYLKNCGFTNDDVKIDSKFKRSALDVAPNINFSQLE